MPKDLWDIEIERGTEDLEWWVLGAKSMTVRFTTKAPAPKTHKKGKKLIPFDRTPGRLTSKKSAGGLVSCRIDRATLSAKAGNGHYVKYIVAVEYMNGGKFKIDPFVIIQP